MGQTGKEKELLRELHSNLADLDAWVVRVLTTDEDFLPEYLEKATELTGQMATVVRPMA